MCNFFPSKTTGAQRIHHSDIARSFHCLYNLFSAFVAEYFLSFVKTKYRDLEMGIFSALLPKSTMVTAGFWCSATPFQGKFPIHT